MPSITKLDTAITPARGQCLTVSMVTYTSKQTYATAQARRFLSRYPSYFPLEVRPERRRWPGGEAEAFEAAAPEATDPAGQRRAGPPINFSCSSVLFRSRRSADSLLVTPGRTPSST